MFCVLQNSNNGEDDGENDDDEVLVAGPGRCVIDFESFNEIKSPLLLRDNEFYYPTSAIDGKKVLIVQDGEKLTFGCHGSHTTFVQKNSSNSSSLGDSYVDALCKKGEFFLDGEKLDVAKMTCSHINEPKLLKTFSQCSDEGADGRTDDLSQLAEVIIGFEFRDNFITQVILIKYFEFQKLFFRFIYVLMKKCTLLCGQIIKSLEKVSSLE